MAGNHTYTAMYNPLRSLKLYFYFHFFKFKSEDNPRWFSLDLAKAGRSRRRCSDDSNSSSSKQNVIIVNNWKKQQWIYCYLYDSHSPWLGGLKLNLMIEPNGVLLHQASVQVLIHP